MLVVLGSLIGYSINDLIEYQTNSRLIDGLRFEYSSNKSEVIKYINSIT